MRTQLLILSAMLGLSAFTRAQDQLFKRDNTKLLVKIMEIGPEEIKYKLFANPTGPTYQENKNNFLLVIYENGKQEVIQPSSTSDNIASLNNLLDPPMTKADSMAYYKHDNNISINFLNFFNNEVGLMYQKEFYKNQFNIVVPVAFGVEKPSITQSVYFGSNSSSYGANNYYTIDHKLYEVGFGINYYPSLRKNFNYYIGPAFRYMQYAGTQNAYIYNNSGGYGITEHLSRSSVLTRYCASITNGVILRTKSRITVNVFGSLGFKNDQTNNPIVNPYTNTEIKTINSAFSLYFWSGINVGFSF